MVQLDSHNFIVDPKIVQKVQRRHWVRLFSLKSHGFEFQVLERKSSPFAILLKPLLAALMLKNEVTRIHGLLAFSCFSPFLVSKDSSSLATVSRQGVKLTSKFADGTVLITRNYAWPKAHAIEKKVLRQMVLGSIDAAWREHNAKIKELELEGLSALRDMTLDEWINVDLVDL